MESWRKAALPTIRRITKVSHLHEKRVGASEEAAFMLKRTLHLDRMIRQIDSSRILYPRGVLSMITPISDSGQTVKRVEFFAREKEDIYGIIRSFHVAYSSERALLELAEASSSVISVRSIESETFKNNTDPSRKTIEDRLVLRRAEDKQTDKEDKSQSSMLTLRPKTPDLSVPPIWLEKMDLKPGARVFVSNPMENYAVPPPNLA